MCLNKCVSPRQTNLIGWQNKSVYHPGCLSLLGGVINSLSPCDWLKTRSPTRDKYLINKPNIMTFSQEYQNYHLKVCWGVYHLKGFWIFLWKSPDICSFSSELFVLKKENSDRSPKIGLMHVNQTSSAWKMAWRTGLFVKESVRPITPNLSTIFLFISICSFRSTTSSLFQMNWDFMHNWKNFTCHQLHKQFSHWKQCNSFAKHQFFMN